MKKVFEAIKHNLHDQNIYFVFPTDIAASRWCEYILESGLIEAISRDRFIAWDSFKAECIRSKHQDKTSIPAVLRKFFAHAVIEKNKRNNLFTTIINPEYASSSESFADWITKILPQLHSWYEKIKHTNIYDHEDADLLTLKNEYELFLNKHDFFDPAWERPPFRTSENRYYIVHPDIIQDFYEYKEILENTDGIQLIYIDKESQQNEVYQYSNSRSEIKELALYIKHICTVPDESGQILQWSDIAVSVNNLETFEPYLLQEFLLYNIPVRLRNGKSLSAYPGGRLFSLIKDCYVENFSFESMKNLILDPVFPWKNNEIAEELINFGIQNNCLFSYDGLDIWLEAFKNAYTEELSKDYYKALKDSITKIANADTFDFLSMHYNRFRETFFDYKNISLETDIIMSRCISELTVLRDLEKSYPEATQTVNPLTFFIEQLNSKEYVIQSKENGVNVFTYKLAASAPYKQHIILHSSQNALTVSNKVFNFLRDDKRNLLGVKDENTSEHFVNLYASHSSRTIRFSCSQNSFLGYEIPYNSLLPIEVLTKNEGNTAKEEDSSIDPYFMEKKLFSNSEANLKTIHSMQHEGFFNWINKYSVTTDTINNSFVKMLRDKISSKIFRDSKLIVSPTTLKDFYECPIKWLFTKILNIDNYTLETDLIDDVYIGTFYHEVLRQILTHFKIENKPLSIEKGNVLSISILRLIETTTRDVVEGFPLSCGIKGLSKLTIELFKSQAESYVQTLTDFFTEFSIWFQGSYVSSLEKEVQIEKDDYILVGTIDCVLDLKGDETTTEGKFIVDFKTGKTPTRSICIKQDNNELKDFQLPLYVYMYENEVFQGQPSVQGCGYMSIHKKNLVPLVNILKPDGRSINPYKKNERLHRNEPNEAGFSFEPTIEASLQAVEKFVSVINDENLSIFTNQDKWLCISEKRTVSIDTCFSCNYKKLCRTTYTIAGERL